MKDKKSLATSVTQKLSAVSKTLGVPYKNILTSFLLERLAYRLVSDTYLRDKLIFKGGYIGLRVFASPRYTVDLDAVFHKGSFDTVAKHAHEAAEADIGDAVWFRYETQRTLATQNEYGGLELVFRAGLGEVPKNIKKAQAISFDIGFGDPVTPQPIEMHLPSLLRGGEELVWKVYPIETAAAEKIHTVVARSDDNSRSKDIFDLWLFLPKCDKKVLQKAIQSTFEYRKTEIPKNWNEVEKKLDTTFLSRGWSSAVSTVPAKDRPPFDEALSKVLKYLSQL